MGFLDLPSRCGVFAELLCLCRGAEPLLRCGVFAELLPVTVERPPFPQI